MSVLLICFNVEPSYHVTSNLAKLSFWSLPNSHLNSSLLFITCGDIVGFERIFGKSSKTPTIAFKKYHISLKTFLATAFHHYSKRLNHVKAE